MADEKTLFETEKKVSKERAAEIISMIAEGILAGDLVLENDDTVELQITDEVELEVEAEEEEEDGKTKRSLEIEVEWMTD